MSIEIFVDSHFSGTSSGRLDKDCSYIRDFWNEKISLIKIYSGTWEFFEHANYQGRSFRLHPGNYPALSSDRNDVISSFKQVGVSAPPAPSDGGIAQKILDLTNDVISSKQVGVSAPPAPSDGGIAQKILDLTNKLRSKFGSSALSLNSQLMAAARTHTDLMIKQNKLSNQLSDEPSLGDRISQTGYQWSVIAENVGRGYHTPEEAVKAWFDSPGHRANLLDHRFQHLGVGYGNGFWTQVFGKSY